MIKNFFGFLGKELGIHTRFVFIRFFKKLKLYFNKLLISIGFVFICYRERIKFWNIFVFVLVIFSSVFLFSYNFYASSIKKKEFKEYYYIDERLLDIESMDLNSIKTIFLDNFTGILKANVALKVSGILKDNENRWKDAIEVLDIVKDDDLPEYLKIIIYINIVNISEQHSSKKDKEIKYLEKVSKQKSQIALFTKEILADLSLNNLNYNQYYRTIEEIVKSEDFRSPYGRERLLEIQYIASQR